MSVALATMFTTLACASSANDSSDANVPDACDVGGFDGCCCTGPEIFAPICTSRGVQCENVGMYHPLAECATACRHVDAGAGD